jgi:hypothetical protein
MNIVMRSGYTARQTPITLTDAPLTLTMSVRIGSANADRSMSARRPMAG